MQMQFFDNLIMIVEPHEYIKHMNTLNTLGVSLC